MKKILNLLACSTLTMCTSTIVISCDTKEKPIIVKTDIKTIFTENYIEIPYWMETNKDNILNAIKVAYPKLKDCKLKLVYFEPEWEVHVDDNDLYFEGFKEFSLIKNEEMPKPPSVKKDLIDIFLDKNIILDKNSELNELNILNKIKEIYPELISTNLKLERLTQLEWNLSVYDKDPIYQGNIIINVTIYKEEEIPKFQIEINSLIEEGSFIQVEENTDEGILESVYKLVPQLINRLFVIYKEEIESNLFLVIINVDDNDEYYQGSVMLKYYFNTTINV
ncbi:MULTISPECIES: hypothetical protein [Mesoplasma]|uniref:Lipoprotein n=1 Tax=Mesoplasma florum TaxID=2151 RepID=A0A2R3P7Q5_MESFO|nr:MULTISPECIES: hypothetical protein [Mesoplasma]AVN64517.1 hypothetical protein CG003_02485 [Mesoplasma florum]